MSELIKEIIDTVDYDLMVTKPSQNLKRGEYVVTGLSATPQGLRQVMGYVTQILIGQGAFGSDAVMIRSLEDCVLTPHENQVFFRLTNYQRELIDKGVFKCSPEGEIESNPLGNYSLSDGTINTGFLIKVKL